MKEKLLTLKKSYFILALIILVTNDFYLKYEYHNWITGKLSDFAGLFVFSSFWIILFPLQKKVVCIFIGLLFVLWKSTYSQTFIDVFSDTVFSIDRTVDVSDLLALMVLPLAYKASSVETPKQKLLRVPTMVLAVFSFCATSVPIPTQTFNEPEYVLFKSADFDYKDQYSNEFNHYQFDTMTVIAIRRIETETHPALDDGYHKSQILKDLDLRILCAINHKFSSDPDLKGYISLRDSLTVDGIKSITIDLDSVTDELHFSGTRLNGIFRRYSKEKDLLIDGRYVNGLEDSIWNFYDRSKNITLRRHFVAGESTMIERFENGKIFSTTSVNTRQDAITKQYVIVIVISIVLCVIVLRLFLNFRASERKLIVPMSNFSAIILIILLPTIIFTIAKLISSFISVAPFDIFQIPGQLIWSNVALIPMLALIFYGLRLRSRFDLSLYILLFTFALIWLDEFGYLRQILF